MMRAFPHCSKISFAAPLVALARVAMGVHYLSDVLAGSLLGIVVGVVGLQFYEAFFAWLANLTGFPLW